jgi:hypothetical protein
VLELIRDVREGRRAYDPEEIRTAVRHATHVQVPYRSVVIDVESGEFVYRHE